MVLLVHREKQLSHLKTNRENLRVPPEFQGLIKALLRDHGGSYSFEHQAGNFVGLETFHIAGVNVGPVDYHD